MPTTAELDRAATGPNVRQRVARPAPGTRCPRCHRPAGKRVFFPGVFLGLGVPCALCSPIQPHEVLDQVVRGRATITFG